jgi:hypothetical protein
MRALTFIRRKENKTPAKKTRAEILNELGRDGWEMVGFGNTFEASGHCIYFKRIKSNQT